MLCGSKLHKKVFRKGVITYVRNTLQHSKKILFVICCYLPCFSLQYVLVKLQGAASIDGRLLF